MATGKLPRKVYETELLRLQGELLRLQEWVRETGSRIVVVLEGRDAAGKGGAIQRVSQYLNPRFCRIVALPAPSARERGRWYFMIHHLLASIPWQPVDRRVLTLPERPATGGYERPPREVQRDVPDHAASLLE
ncbi:hypothetical protein H7X46_02850 [Pseudonocardia sp. C8]|uniref:hypothetical protein n=1 Tax=Pseudonocardia sp. C8 TaxID=2762759 RepID=UPI001642FCA3|nr:hypothetical protein [Pseudonocardia sp. C8]MBC3190000.1 hypothetical protein [Pseudonocardia sp. C8]